MYVEGEGRYYANIMLKHVFSISVIHASLYENEEKSYITILLGEGHLYS